MPMPHQQNSHYSRLIILAIKDLTRTQSGLNALNTQLSKVKCLHDNCLGGSRFSWLFLKMSIDKSIANDGPYMLTCFRLKEFDRR